MFLHHLNSLECADKITRRETNRTKQSLWRVRDESKEFAPSMIFNSSIRFYQHNIYHLNINKNALRRIYLETCPRCFFLTIFFKCFCYPAAEHYKSVRDEYINAQIDLDSLIGKNLQKLEQRFLSYMRNFNEIEDPMELAHLFVYGCYRDSKSFDFLKKAYKRIAEFSNQGNYSLNVLREIARASRSLFLKKALDIQIEVERDKFTFHRLLLGSQSQYFRRSLRVRNFFHFTDLDSTVFRLIHAYIERGDIPDFDMVGEPNVYHFLYICDKLMLPKEISRLALSWLLRNSVNFKIKENDKGLEIAFRRNVIKESLLKLIYLDKLFSIDSLDVSMGNYLNDDLVNIIIEVCPNIRKLTCKPFIGVSKEAWMGLFNLPSFKILELNVDRGFGLHYHLKTLIDVFKNHRHPPKVRLVNDRQLSTDMVLEIASFLPTLNFLNLAFREDVFPSKIKNLFESHPNLWLKYESHSFRNYRSFYSYYRSKLEEYSVFHYNIF